MQQIKAYLVGDHAVNAEGKWLYTNDLQDTNLTLLEIVMKKILLVVVHK